jgi:hypothetical protein
MPEDLQKYGVRLEVDLGGVRIQVFAVDGKHAVGEFKDALAAVEIHRSAADQSARGR